MTTMKQNPWIHIPQFLSRQHSDILCKLLADFPWIEEASEPQQRSAYFGKSYSRDGGPRPHEHSVIHPALLPITKQIAYAALRKHPDMLVWFPPLCHRRGRMQSTPLGRAKES
jgi:hypothetical protein